ncbi:sugar phosphate isomerase/epimerase [Pelagovum pacificum]|uniref:Sugar phosphate isomerase/epimerase n=2 Tax=Pelagovum pacificum TaxID=2588711 RepID=A0A5C5GJM2_9RHOB|nr:sugar phosphate isomerase/epimerase [Pelagovum pacificum]
MIEGADTVLDRFRMAADAGFDGIEPDLPGDVDLDEMLAASRETGVAIPGAVNSVHWKAPLSDPDPEVRAAGRSGMIRAMEDAATVGADTVLLVPGKVDAQTSYRSACDFALSHIAELIPHAERTGVRIALENVWNDFLLSPIEAARFLDEFDSPHLGWYLDIGNVLKIGNPRDWIEELGNRIFRIDVKEYSLDRMNDEGPWKGFDVELGDGDCDWAAVNAALKSVGYRGWGSIEMPGGGPERLADLRARADRIRAL